MTHWLTARGITPDKKLIDRILQAAKESSQILTEDEIMKIVNS